MTAAVFCDVDGTLVDTSIPRTFLWVGWRLSVFQHREALRCLATGMLAGALPAPARGHLLFHGLCRLMRGHSSAEMQLVTVAMLPYLRRALKAETLTCLQAHQAQGQQIILLSAGLQNVLQLLAAPLGALAEGTSLEEVDGCYTGRGASAICWGREKARRICRLAAQRQLDLAVSTGYGDSVADVHFLRLTGRAVAVDPDRGLRDEALRRSWPIIDSRTSRADGEVGR